MKRAGIIGCGNIGHIHAAVLMNMKEARLVAFADSRIERAKEYAEQYGEENSKYYTSLEDMLNKAELDVLHICSPHHLHVSMACYALAQGVHVFMEKPPAITREEFKSLQEAQQDYARSVGVCFQNRYNRAVLEAHQLLNSNKIGCLIGARAFVTWNREKEYYAESGWRGKLSSEGGGVLINQAIHTLDLLIGFLGKAQSVEATISNHSLKNLINVEDTVQAYIQFERTTACFYATNAYVMDAPILLELAGENGLLRIEGEDLKVQYRDGACELYSWSKDQISGKAYWGNSHGSCIADFYRCLDSGREYSNDLKSTKDTFHLVMDIYEAAKE